MQDRYAGDIGDYVKLALLRTLSPTHKLGVAWYLYPDESHNSDGRHTSYLDQPLKWRDLDPVLFDALSAVRAQRSVTGLENTGMLSGGAVFAGEPVTTSHLKAPDRSSARFHWFERLISTLEECDLVFADPDNGLIDDGEHRRREGKFGKQMPLSEAKAFATGRQAVIYHHNTRFPGGHALEVEAWQLKLGPNTVAIRANAFSCRTFFILNASDETRERAIEFAERWANHRVQFVGQSGQ